jgi:predicted CoA-binding protein
MQQNLYGTDEMAQDLMENAQVWVVVGLGQDQTRAAYGVARFLQNKGKQIVPVHPRALEVLGQPGFKTLAEAKAAVGKIDVVDFFVASSRVGEIMQQAIDLELPALWLQLDVVDEEKAQAAIDAGIAVIMNRCPAIEWPRLMAGREL